MAADEEDNQRIIGEDVYGRIQVQQEEDGAQNRPEDGENFDFPAPLSYDLMALYKYAYCYYY